MNVLWKEEESLRAIFRSSVTKMKSIETQPTIDSVMLCEQDRVINSNSEEYDGRKDILLERTFRFKNIAEFVALTTRERARILRAQKEREEYENSW